MRSAPPLYLPDGYVENPAASADAGGTPYWDKAKAYHDRWQEPVYRLARRCITNDTRTVLDVGCGTGHKLVRNFAGAVDRLVGLDQASGVDRARMRFPAAEWIAGDLHDDETWGHVAALAPDLMICADVVEHLVDPLDLLDRLRAVSCGPIVLSTPDRARVEDAPPLGPPLNPRHVREWTMDELQALVTSRGFTVDRALHLLPRSYAPAMVEVRRAVWRLLHLRAVPDRRSCSVVVLRAGDSTLT